MCFVSSQKNKVKWLDHERTMTVSRRDFLKAVGITSGCFTLGGAGLVAAQPNLLPPPDENLLPPPDEYTESKKEVYRQLYGGSPTGTSIEPYAKDIEVFNTSRYPSNDAFIPDIWAQTALNILNENMVVGNLIHRDFQNEMAQHGDVVNLRKPNNFRMQRRKTDDDDLFDIRMETTRHVVPLDAHFYTSFIIRDGDAAGSFKDLVNMYVFPAMVSMARGIDRYAIEKMWIEGDKNAVTNHDAQDLILDARTQLNNNRAPLRDRHMIVPPSWCLMKFAEPADPLRYLGFDIYEDVDVAQGLAFHQSALTLLNRPLWVKTAVADMGARIASTSFNDISMRCSMTYDAMKAGTRVTFDTLFGAAVLEPAMITVANKQQCRASCGGVYYDPGVERPRFISPPAKPAEFISRLYDEHGSIRED